MWCLEVIVEMNRQKPKPVTEKTSSTVVEKVNQSQEKLEEIKVVLEEAKKLLTQDSQTQATLLRPRADSSSPHKDLIRPLSSEVEIS